MILLFTTPRPLEGHYRVIQSNALRSWTHMNPGPERIVVFADEEHEGKEAIDLIGECGFELFPVERRSEHGVPLLSDLFPRAQQAAGINSTPCYTNADIILGNSFVGAIEEAASHFDRCLIVARRWNVQVLDHLVFEDGWYEGLWEKIHDQGSIAAPCAIDLFAWKGDVWHGIPDFAIGRYAWDNWLVGRARANGVPVVDITTIARLIHQSHHIVAWEDPDAQKNFRLATVMGAMQHSTHTLTADGLKEGWIRGV